MSAVSAAQVSLQPQGAAQDVVLGSAANESVLERAVEILRPRPKRVRDEQTEKKNISKKSKSSVSETAAIVGAGETKIQDLRQSLQVLGGEGSRVTLRQSTIAGAGLGIFATGKKLLKDGRYVTFEQGDPITEYSGQMLTYEQAKTEKRPFSHLRTHSRQRYVIDGTRLPNGTLITDPKKQMQGHGVGAFANHGVEESTRNADFDYVDSERNHRAFAVFKAGGPYKFDPASRVTFLRAKRDIAPGEEILVDYGRDYLGFGGQVPRAVCDDRSQAD